MSRSWFVGLVCGLLAVSSVTAQADVLVLVHGWSAGAETWVRSGVVPVLERNGWADAGVVVATPGGISHYPAPGVYTANPVYRAQLPEEAPLAIQAAHLFAELAFIRERHRNQPIVLVGHSAGGVVARLAVVRPDASGVEMLVTIAAPNLGTSRAIEGLEIVDSKPFFCPGPGIDFLKSLFGGDKYRYLRDSQDALVDLVPASPGTIIDWLNHQAHPDIAYCAVVRTGAVYDGDELVPAFSQDLNNVPALRGRAQVHVTPSGHALQPADGELLSVIVAPYRTVAAPQKALASAQEGVPPSRVETTNPPGLLNQ